MREEKTIYSRLELDSHADTIVLGRNCIVLAHTGRECDVSPYTDSYESIKGVSIVTGATAWTCQVTGETCILVFNEALWMGEVLEHSLLNPNQMRHYGVTVQDNPFDKRGIYLEEEEESEKIPLQSEGTTIYLTTRTPTERELHECCHITLSSKAAWNPNEVQFPEYGHQRMEEELPRSRNSRINVCECGLNPDTIVERLIAEVRVNVTDDVPTRRTFVSNERHLGVSAEELSDRWCIGLSQAQHPIKVTTQLATRSATLPLSRRYTADRVFETPLFRGQFYCDTMDGRCKLLDGNRYSQVFASKDFFAVIYPMETKSMAGDALRQ